MQTGKSAGLSSTNIKTIFAQSNEDTFNSCDKGSLEDYLFPRNISPWPPFGIAHVPITK